MATETPKTEDVNTQSKDETVEQSTVKLDTIVDQELEHSKDSTIEKGSKTESKESTVDSSSAPNSVETTTLLSEVNFNISSAKITNADEIKKYDEYFQTEFYIPEYEAGTYDEQELFEHNYIDSAEKIGSQLQSIAIAICDDDPTMKLGLPEYNPDSKFRIHGRIADGRHRYLEAKGSGITWKHEYYRVTNFQEFMMLRSHMDVKKQQSKAEMINKFTQIAEYYHEQGIQTGDVCKRIVKDFSPPYPVSSIRNWVPDKYKDSVMAERRAGSLKKVEETASVKRILKKEQNKSDKKLSKKDSKIDELNKKLSGNTQEIVAMQEHAKVLETKVKEFDELSPYLTQKHEVMIDGTEEKVSVELDYKNGNVYVRKV